jgi:hypothetical protein
MTEENQLPQADEPPQAAAMRRAARGMSATSDLATKLLCAYVQGGGTWAGLGVGHVEKAFQIANTFMQIAEGQWIETMKQIQNDFTPTEIISAMDTGGGGGVDEKVPTISLVPYQPIN